MLAPTSHEPKPVARRRDGVRLDVAADFVELGDRSVRAHAGCSAEAGCKPANLTASPASAAAKVSWDHVGALASALCVVHCIALPFLLPMLAVCGLSLAGWECCGPGAGLVHLLLYCLVVPVAVVALVTGYVRHRNRTAVVLGAAGMLLLSVALVAAQMPTAIVAERALTLAGSAALIAAHLQNQRAGRRRRVGCGAASSRA